MERNDPSTDNKSTRLVGIATTESSWKGSEEDKEWAQDSHCFNQHQVGAGIGVGGCTTGNMSRQHWDWIPTGEKLTGGIHMQYSLGYNVWEEEAEIRHWGGITIV